MRRRSIRAQQSAAAQKLQFGYNNDYLGYIPMPGAANPSHHGLLVVNHEYTNEELMFPGLGRQDLKDVAFAKMTKDLVEIEMAAHGGAVIEVRRENGKWRVVAGSKYRPAHRLPTRRWRSPARPPVMTRLQTTADPTGRRVLGMVNNCAGGVTPWGTWLTCEENFHGYFWGRIADDHPEARNYKRYGVPGNWYAWGKWHDRFDVDQGAERGESLRLGRRDRPVRSGLDAEEAHRARPHQA